MKDLGLWVILFLPILSVRDIFQLAGVAPAADDAVGIDSDDVREAGGDDGHRAENEDVSVFRGV